MPATKGDTPETMRRYEMRGTPTLILIDREGRLRLHTFGRPDDMLVGAAIAGLVAENSEGPLKAVAPDGLGESQAEAPPGATCDDEGCSV